MAKMFATEAAQRVIDRAVQLHGGLGVVDGSVVESLRPHLVAHFPPAPPARYEADAVQHGQVLGDCLARDR